MPSCWHRPSQNSPVHLASRSDTISSGRPWSLHISLRKAFAQSVAVAVSMRGTKWANFVKRSTTTITCVCPLDSGNAVMKSTEVDTHGEGAKSRGCNNPYRACRGDLFRWQTSQLLTYWFTQSSRLGQWKFRDMSSKVFFCPKCPATWPSCSLWAISNLIPSWFGTCNLFLK